MCSQAWAHLADGCAGARQRFTSLKKWFSLQAPITFTWTVGLASFKKLSIVKNSHSRKGCVDRSCGFVTSFVSHVCICIWEPPFKKCKQSPIYNRPSQSYFTWKGTHMITVLLPPVVTKFLTRFLFTAASPMFKAVSTTHQVFSNLINNKCISILSLKHNTS